MKIEIWSDFVCPFCYIGKRRLESALERFPGKDQVEVVYKSFELDPNAKRDGNPNVYDMLAAKYGMSREQAIANTNQVAAMARTEGLEFRMGEAIQTNTFDAHRLAHFAASHGKLQEMTERLLKAHFTDSLHLGKPEVLADLAAEVGLDREAALEALNSDKFADEVRRDEQEAAMLGVRGVPFFVINRKYAISGAQPTEVFAQALQKAWGEEQPLVMVDGADDAAVCTEDGCEVPERNSAKD